MSAEARSDEPSERLVLELVGGDLPPAELPRAGVLTIGSSRTRAAYAIEGAGVAEVHCAIGRTKDGGWALKDLGSTAGTRVNGKAVESARLQAGDEIAIGTRRLRVVDPARPAHVPQPTAEPRQAPGPRQAPEPPAQSDIPSGSIAGYRIEGRLGRGAMGQVYLAVQERLDRKVALKVLSAKVEADHEFVRRFQAEAKAAAALNHPNVVTVYDVGESAGVHYLSMEYMDAGSLEERIARGGPLPWRDALRVLHDAASGLVYAESKGIVHRDIKPANLMQNHAGTTKIADLGLAVPADAEASAETGTKVLGTPHFMSPEQARGDRLDSRSDLYSLGATAYRILTGRTPFEGASSRDILRAHLRDEPRPIRELARDLPPEVAAIVERLMRKEPSERQPSARALLADLERIPTGAVPAAPAPARSSRRILVALVPAVLAALAVAWFAVLRDDGSAAPHDVGAAPPPEPRQPEPVVTPELPAPPPDDDTELKLHEAEARLAFLELESRAMDPQSRRDALRALAAQHRGTTAASEGLARADALDHEIQGTLLRDQERAETLSSVMTRLRAAAALEAAPPRPADSFRAMSEVVGQEALADDPAFAAARRDIEQALVDRAIAHAQSALGSLDQRMRSGDFADAAAELEALLPVFDVPGDLAERGLARVEVLRALGDDARSKLAGLDAERSSYLSEAARADVRALAEGLGGSQGLERELATLDLAAAEKRAAGLAKTLVSAQARGFAEALAADLARARSALETLGREYSASGWRRRTVADPRDSKRPTYDAVGADGSGILLEVGGKVERVPWSAFGGDPRELHRLFFDRLQRPWSADEQASIAALLRLSAVARALAVVGPLLDPKDGPGSPVPSRTERDLAETFESLSGWAPGSAEARRTEREIHAVDLLRQILARASGEDWSVAAADLERLLDEYGDTLFVRCLSDGTRERPREAAFVAPPAEPEAVPGKRVKPDDGSAREDDAHGGGRR